MSNLFQNKPFIGHAGQELPWKVECDGLTDDDWKWAAARVAERFSFCVCVGVPRGGWPFADALRDYCDGDSPNALICDDVLTTGKSIQEYAVSCESKFATPPMMGVVLFARIKPAPWIHAIWRLW